MIDVSKHRFADPLDGVQQGYEFGNALRQDSARQRAGNALRGGDYGAASGELYGAGMLSEGAGVQKLADTRRNDVLKFTADAAGRLSDFHASNGGDVNKTLAAFDQMAPRFQQFGETPEEVAEIRQQLQANPGATLVALGAGAAKELGYELRTSGDEVLVFQGGKLVNRYRGAKTATLNEGTDLVEIPGSYGDPPSGFVDPATQPQGPGVPAGQTGIVPTRAQLGGEADDVWAAIIQRESGGDGNAEGPQTPYGRAQGSTQMLMGTAEGMARKLGVPWRPDLMRGDTPRALAYQEQLGRAYFDEGMERYGGDTRKAAMYYHGGPNEKIWGPKTQSYGDAVAGGGQSYQVAANGETPPPPSGVVGGARVLMSRPKAPKEQTRPATAEEKAAYGIPADVPAQRKPDGSIDVISGVATHAKAPPQKIQAGWVANNTSLQQIDEAIRQLEQNPSAMGIMNGLGDEIRQRTDKGGIATRAAVARIGAVQIHDLSGAAVTAAETPRLKPFVPMPTDTAEAAIIKLRQMRQEVANNNSQIEVAYGPDSGYAPIGGGRQGGASNATLNAARAAIQKGAPRDKVIERLRSAGIDPSGL